MRVDPGGKFPETINGRYEIIRKLGEGGMGAVYLVADRRAGGRHCALKRVRRDRLDERGLELLRHEFLSLYPLSHPNLTRVYEFGTELRTGDLFFTSEYVDGSDWMRFRRSLDTRREEHLRTFLDVLAQILRGLEFIHCRGLVHGDIKPGNILIRHGKTSPPTAKLIDFGLIRREREFSGKKIVGTPLYVAPETILGSQVDRRTDLYSLGVVLYHLIAGEPPFRGRTNLELIKAHVDIPPPPLPDTAPGELRALEPVVLRLMEKRPVDRFQNALEVIGEIRGLYALDLPLETEETGRSYLLAARLVGRERERETLEAAVRRLVRRSAEEKGRSEGDRALADSGSARARRVLIVKGENGQGKRWLIDEFRSLVQSAGAQFFEIESECSKSSSGGIVALLGELEWFFRAIDQSGAHGIALRLGKVLPRKNGTPTEETSRDLRRLAVELLKASRRVPAVLHVHRLQRLGPGLRVFLAGLTEALAEESVPDARFLLTATVEEGEGNETADYAALADDRTFAAEAGEIRLRRLDADGVAAYLASAFGRQGWGRAFVERIHRESDGVPAAVLELLAYLLRKGAVLHTPEGWRFRSVHDLESAPGRIRRKLAERIRRLPRPARRLAIAFALFKEPWPPEFALRLCGMDRREAKETLGLLVRARLLDEVRDPGRPPRYAVVSEGTRRLLLAHLTAESRTELHARAGALLEEARRRGKEVTYRELAYQYLLARRADKAFDYGLEAARRLRDLGRLQEALDDLERLLALIEKEEAAAGLRARPVRRAIAALKFDLGDYEGALAVLAPLCEVGTQEPEPEVLIEAAKNHLRLGEFRSCEELLEAVSGRSPDLEAEADLVRSELHWVRGNALESLRRLQLVIKRDEVLNAAERHECQVESLLGEDHMLLLNFDVAARHFRRAERSIQTAEDALSRARGLFLRANYYRAARQYAQAKRHLELAAQAKERLRARDALAESLLRLGELELQLGRPDRAKARLTHAVEHLSGTGNRPRLALALSLLGDAHSQLGEREDAAKCLADAQALSRDLEWPQLEQKILLAQARQAVEGGDLENGGRYLYEAEQVHHPGTLASLEEVCARLLRARMAFMKAELGNAFEQASQALRMARELGEPVIVAQTMAFTADICAHLGNFSEARRQVVTLLDTARSHDWRPGEGWARLIEGTILRTEGKLEKAAGVLSMAAEHLLAEGGERDRMRLYLEQGITFLKLGRAEEAYLDLEEGLHLAKKLGLDYEQCRFHLALGAFESETPDGNRKRAEKALRLALRRASAGPYPELLWQAQYRLGKLLLDREGSSEEAEAYLRESARGLHWMLADVPAALRPGYLRTLPDRVPTSAMPALAAET